MQTDDTRSRQSARPQPPAVEEATLLGSGRVLDVLAVLHGEGEESLAVSRRAVHLAQTERARLMIAQTTTSERIAAWCGPIAMQFGVNPRDCLPMDAFVPERLLAKASAGIPNDVSLRTALLGANASKGLRRFLAGLRFDVVLIGASALADDGKLRRVLATAPVQIVAVAAE